jgi:hypothetical protein
VPRMMTVTSYAVYFAANSLGYQDWRATSGILSQEPGTECVIHFVHDTAASAGSEYVQLTCPEKRVQITSPNTNHYKVTSCSRLRLVCFRVVLRIGSRIEGVWRTHAAAKGPESAQVSNEFLVGCMG